MNPALSVIFFTVASGAGYGAIFLLGLFGPFGAFPDDGWFGFVGYGVALALVTAGLLSSTVHLGHPERAWRAVSQWRTSWLSREGVAALITFPPALIHAASWTFAGEPGGFFGIFGVLAALMAVVTVFATGMIYASLKPIRRWNNPWTVPGYFAIALMTGGFLATALACLFGGEARVAVWAALIGTVAAWLIKAGYWHVRSDAGGPTAESATGLGRFGKVRLLESPHSEENYLLKEMGYRIGRKHAATLRGFVHVAGFALPLIFAIVLVLDPGRAWSTLLSMLGVFLTAMGAFVERWLFFAEAKHTVTLYYGAAAA